MRIPLARPILAGILAGSLGAGAALAATPPAQPERGPGSTEYSASAVAKRAVGRTGAGTFAFHGVGAPREARPVVVLLHAWGAANPSTYGGWIEHMARRGYLVLVPRFQEVGRTRPAEATANAAARVREAIEALREDEEARPDLGRVAIVGHLAGAAIGLNLAVGAAAQGLPAPKLVFALMPGGVATDPKSRGVPLADLSGLDPRTMLVAMSPDREHLASDRLGRRILKEATSVPAERKLFMRVLSDDHGFPALSATLASPGSVKEEYDGERIKFPPDPPGTPPNRQKWTPDMVLSGEQTVLVQQLANNLANATDYYGFWKTFDAAAAAAFAGRDALTLRNDPAFTDTGRWSDGWPVRRLAVETPRPEAATGQGPAGSTARR
jgi:acetyl esterase/lipase